jgi:sec-independent protein translocase protein TatC
MRLIVVVLVFLAASIVAYVFRTDLIQIVRSPLQETLYYTSPAGGLSFTLTICILCGAVVATPVAIYQLFRFVEPALSPDARRGMPLILAMSTLLLATGICFAYFLIIPAAISFLSHFSDSAGIQSLISASEYLRFIGIYLVGFGILFQLPLVLLLINAAVRLPADKLLEAIPVVGTIIVILAAIITPTTDPWNLFLAAGPAIALYLGSVALVGLVNWRRPVAEVSRPFAEAKEEAAPKRKKPRGTGGDIRSRS